MTVDPNGEILCPPAHRDVLLHNDKKETPKV